MPTREPLRYDTFHFVQTLSVLEFKEQRQKNVWFEGDKINSLLKMTDGESNACNNRKGINLI